MAESDPKPLHLDPLQQYALDRALAAANIFLTGGPGTGKSFTLQTIIAELKKKHGGDSVLVTAPTGIAAILVGGQTLHSKPGPGISKGNSNCFSCMWHNKDQWRRVRTLVIDEISMVDAEFLDWYMATVYDIRKSFDDDHCSLQLIFCGDFYQLPPVAAKNGKCSLKHLNDFECVKTSCIFVPGENSDASTAKYCPVQFQEIIGQRVFLTAVWRNSDFETCNLTRSFRTNDDMLLNALKDIRNGLGSSLAISKLIKETKRKLPEHLGDDGLAIIPTELYTTRAEVSGKNNTYLEDLDFSSKMVYDSTDMVYMDNPEDEWMNKDLRHQKDLFKKDLFWTNECPVGAQLELRIGAQVMLLKNEIGAAVTDITKLVNGSRGVVTGFAVIQPVDPGDFDGLAALRSNPMIKYPIVRFDNGRVKTFVPVDFSKFLYLKATLVRKQIPLALAWTQTVHKSQGQSISKLFINLSNCFAEGQAYVAISRAQSVTGLQIINYKPSEIKTSPLVQEFYKCVDKEMITRQNQVQTFISELQPWWTPILHHPAWQTLFSANATFRSWIDTYPVGPANPWQNQSPLNSPVRLSAFSLNSPSPVRLSASSRRASSPSFDSTSLKRLSSFPLNSPSPVRLSASSRRASSPSFDSTSLKRWQKEDGGEIEISDVQLKKAQRVLKLLGLTHPDALPHLQVIARYYFSGDCLEAKMEKLNGDLLIKFLSENF